MFLPSLRLLEVNFSEDLTERICASRTLGVGKLTVPSIIGFLYCVFVLGKKSRGVILDQPITYLRSFFQRFAKTTASSFEL